MKYRLFIILSLILTSLHVSFAQKPILPDFHADPSAHEWDGKYWIYPSTDEPGSTKWEEMRRWECFSSTDLVNWENHGQIFSLEDISWASHSAFAPDCMKWKGKYYFFFPAEYKIGVAIADSPTGPFKDALGKPLIDAKEAEVVSFDPCIFIDDDSTAYLYYGGHRTIGMVKLTNDLLHRDGEIKKLDLKGYDEGIWVHKRNGIYYFSYPTQIMRDGKINQLLVYCTAPTPYGPFRYHGSILDNKSRNSHHSIVNFNNQWYLFYHIQGPSGHERRVCAEYLYYNEDGTIKPIEMTSTGIDPVK